ncbi:hypothetical protein B0H19DRAFT_1079064 [Mycena capillaripes]|nr:hypothetical protein B0H19DRAFT_1079064 [Mycena capillaripes]
MYDIKPASTPVEESADLPLQSENASLSPLSLLPFRGLSHPPDSNSITPVLFECTEGVKSYTDSIKPRIPRYYISSVFQDSLHFRAASANPLAEALGQPRPIPWLDLAGRVREGGDRHRPLSANSLEIDGTSIIVIRSADISQPEVARSAVEGLGIE